MNAERLTRLFARSVQEDYPVVAPEPLLSEFYPTSFTSSAGPAILLEHLEKGQTRYPSRCHVVQPCLRYWDIPRVGDDSHLSFFEMVACASFQEGGRVGTISAVVRFLAENCCVGKDRLWATYFRGGRVRGSGDFGCDREAMEFWIDFGLERSHVVPVDSEEGFVANQTEPVGGYRTEVYVEMNRGRPRCATCVPASCTCGRFLELATSVAYEYSVRLEGDHFIIVPLNSQSMYAAGLGVERLESVLEGHGVVHRTTRMLRLLDTVRDSLSGQAEQQAAVKLCDAARALLFLYAGGAGDLSGKANKSRRWVLNKWLSICRALAPEPSILERLLRAIVETHAPDYTDLAKEVNAVLGVLRKQEHLEAIH